MARVSTYLNFARNTEQVFLFYKSVFGGDFNQPIHRMATRLPHLASRRWQRPTKNS